MESLNIPSNPGSTLRTLNLMTTIIVSVIVTCCCCVILALLYYRRKKQERDKKLTAFERWQQNYGDKEQTFVQRWLAETMRRAEELAIGRSSEVDANKRDTTAIDGDEALYGVYGSSEGPEDPTSAYNVDNMHNGTYTH